MKLSSFLTLVCVCSQFWLFNANAFTKQFTKEENGKHVQKNSKNEQETKLPKELQRVEDPGGPLSMLDIEMGGYCNSTVIENRPLPKKPKYCRVSLYTAAHCAFKDRDLVIRLPGGKAMTFSKELVSVHVRRDTSHDHDRVARGGDSSVLSITAECEKLKRFKPIPLGKPQKKVAFLMQKRLHPYKSPTHYNRGLGKQLKASLVSTRIDSCGEDWCVSVPKGQKRVITGADSGGAIIQDGKLVGSISGSTTPKIPPDINIDHLESQVTFDATGTEWAKTILAKMAEEDKSNRPKIPVVPPSKYVNKLASNVVAVDGVRVPQGATGYWFDLKGALHWVFEGEKPPGETRSRFRSQGRQPKAGEKFVPFNPPPNKPQSPSKPQSPTPGIPISG